ncbi:MAG: fliS [Betaproteobacteria bacterium]|nr:fliS [Betaproteobacteria bacterium]
MFAAYRSPARAYAGVAVETSIAAARPIDLVVMLYEGANEGIHKAITHMHEGNIAGKGEAITRVIRIIDEGLKAALDPRGGEIALQLSGLYDYMTRRLLLGSLQNDPVPLEEVRGLLQNLKSAWDELARTPNAGAGAPALPAVPRLHA